MCGLWKTKPKEDFAASERQFAERVLLDVLDQHTKIRLVFEKDILGVAELPVTLLSVEPLALTLEIPAAKRGLERITGEYAVCYVNILDRTTKQRAFYTFSSQITLVEFRKNGQTFLRISPPQEVHLAQQRCSVRVPVNQERIPLFIAWREIPAGSHLSEAPPLLNNKARNRNNFKIENISTCGVCLQLHKTVLSGILPELNTGDVFTFYFKAAATPKAMAKPFLLNAALRSIFQPPAEEKTSLGFEFLATGRLTEQRKLIWTPLKSHEVFELIAFVFKWDLSDFHREKHCDR